LIKTYDPELYKACTSTKYPWSNAIVEFMPGTWRIHNDRQYNAFAHFRSNGELWIQVGDQRYQHSWESVGKDHFKIDGNDVKARFNQVLIGLPEVGEKASISKLYLYQPKVWGDYEGKLTEPVNTTMIRTDKGEFSYSGDFYWYGPHPSNGETVEYQELGRSSSRFFGIFLYHEETHTYVNLSAYQKKINVTTSNQPVMQWARIIDVKSDRLNGFD
jgi:hypothetical protein